MSIKLSCNQYFNQTTLSEFHWWQIDLSWFISANYYYSQVLGSQVYGITTGPSVLATFSLVSKYLLKWLVNYAVDILSLSVLPIPVIWCPCKFLNCVIFIILTNKFALYKCVCDNIVTKLWFCLFLAKKTVAGVERNVAKTNKQTTWLQFITVIK